MESVSTQLIERLQRGDNAAYAELLSRYQRPLTQFCYRLLGDWGDVEDVVQEVFVRVHRHVGQYRFRNGAFSTWLFALARNACLDRLRHRQRRPTLPLALAPEPVIFPQETHNRELAEQVAAAIARLPAAQRTALMLAEYEGLSYSEIAVAMGCSKKAVEARLYRAKQSLRKCLASERPFLRVAVNACVS